MNKIRIPKFTVKQVLATLSETIDWGLLVNGIPETWEITQGEGITVYILDTAGTTVHPDLVENFSGGTNFSSSRKMTDVQGHGCVSPETLVQTNFCGIESIKKLYDKIDIKENFSKEYGGYVKDVSKMGIKTYSLNRETGETEIDKILLLHKTNINNEIINLKLDGNIKYSLTPWHKIYTIKMGNHNKLNILKKRADELKVGDMITSPRNGKEVGHLITEYFRGKGSAYKECLSCGNKQEFHKENRASRWQCKKCNKSKYETKYYEYLITEDWAYLIGLILTDGHVWKKKNQYRIEISSASEDFLRSVQERITKIGINNSTIERASTCFRLRFDKKSIHALVKNLGILSGSKSYIQGLPEFIGKSPYGVICSFIAGVLDGDGCVSRNGKNRITTASEKFAKEMCSLLNSIGINSSYLEYKQYSSKIIKKTDKSAKVYNICFYNMKEEIAKNLLIDYKREGAFNNIAEKKGRRFGKRIKEISKETINEDFYDFTTEKNHTYIANGHYVSNTHVAGIVAASKNDTGVVGVAPKASLCLVKVLGDNGTGSMESIERGLKFCYETIKNKEPGTSIVSMSLGADGPLGERIHSWIKKLHEINVPIICAVGNSGTEGVNYPAKYPETIAVGAYNEDGELADFSTTGGELDFVAPGVNIYSTWPINSYACISGSSMSTPFISGIVALLLSKHKKQEAETGLNDCKTVNQIREHLVKHAIDKGDIGRDKCWGYGVVDVKKMLED